MNPCLYNKTFFKRVKIILSYQVKAFLGMMELELSMAESVNLKKQN